MTFSDRPLAAKGLTSYRCRNRYGWTMIGATSPEEALREARRSWEGSRAVDLQVRDGAKNVPVTSAEEAAGAERS